MRSSFSRNSSSHAKNRSKSSRRGSTLKKSTKKQTSKNSPYLLEVKMRAHTLRRQKERRLLAILAKLVLGAFLALSLLIGGRTLAEKFFFQNRDYTLKHLNASLDGVLSVEELGKKTGIVEGKNIFLCNIGRAETLLGDIAEVKQVHIERLWPDTINVSVVRRQPVVRCAASAEEGFVPDRSLLLDEDGVVIHATGLDSHLLGLPVVYGLNLENATLGEPLTGEQARFLLNLYHALSDAKAVAMVVVSIDLSHDYYAVVSDDQKSHFLFGKENIAAQIKRLSLLLEHCQKHGKIIDQANLMLEHNTPVTFQPLQASKKSSR